MSDKKTYCVRNWREYNKALVQRGKIISCDLTFRALEGFLGILAEITCGGESRKSHD